MKDWIATVVDCHRTSPQGKSMNITFKLCRPLSQLIGSDTFNCQIPEATTLQHAIQQLLKDGSTALKQCLQGDDHTLRPSIVLMVNNQQVSAIEQHILKDQDTVTLLSPMAGG